MASTPSLPATTHESSNIVLRLFIMMFLQFAIWGAWAPVCSGYMKDLGFTDVQISLVYLTTAIGAMLSPLVAGWIADRIFPNQIFTACVHLLGAVLIGVAWKTQAFGPFWWIMLAYAVLYMPTIALTNAIAFHHMKDAQKFGYIRVAGTLGWIFINWTFSLYLDYHEKHNPGVSYVGNCLLFSAVLSIIMGFYCFTLPNTPAAKHAKNPYAFLEALKLCKNRNFAVLLVISFVVAIELPFYYNFTFVYLTEPGAGVGLAPSRANFAMSLGQVAEVVLMLLLAPSIRHLGMRSTIVLGILAWPVRYAIFAIGQPAWLVIAAQSLHGICYAFFFVAGMIAVEKLAHKDIRASAQGLIVFATNGVGMLLGSLLAGKVVELFNVPGKGHQWAYIFMVPIVLTIIAAVAFWPLFNEKRFQADAAQAAQEEVPT